MTRTDYFPILHQTASTYQLMLTPLLGPRLLKLLWIPLYHSSHVSQQQILLTYSSKIFPESKHFSSAPLLLLWSKHYQILLLSVSDIPLCLPMIYSSAFRAFLLKHESSNQTLMLTFHFTQSKSQNLTKVYKAPEELILSIHF